MGLQQSKGLQEDLKQKEEALSRSLQENKELCLELIKKLRAESNSQPAEMSTSAVSAEPAEMSTSAVSAELAEMREQYSKMKSTMERLYTKHVMVENAFFQDGSATPQLLQAAADTVKDATAICASDLFNYTKQLSLPINYCAYFGSSVEHMMASPGGKRVPKMALQAFLCNLLFKDFEAPDSFTPREGAPFERPELLKKQRLQAYHRFRYVEPADIINGGLQHADAMEARCNEEFKLFFESKFGCFAKEVEKMLLMSEKDSQKRVLQIMKDPSKPFYRSFLRLATAVWLLQKLAFAFEPANAEIFRVSQGSAFEGEYMENMVQPGFEEDEEQSDESAEELVGFMSVPGFTVRNCIIKSRVCLASLFN